MKRRLPTPSPSTVLLTAQEIARLAQSIARDFRETHFELYVAAGGASEVQIAKTSFSDPTLDTVANNESRMNALSIASRKLDDALLELRSAHGLISGASKGESRGSSWTGQELEEAEASARDKNPRGMGRRVAVRAIR